MTESDNKERVAFDLMKYLCENVLSVDAKPHNRDSALNLYSECLTVVKKPAPQSNAQPSNAAPNTTGGRAAVASPAFAIQE